MELPVEDAERFFRVHHSLMFFLNERLKVIDMRPASPVEYAELPPELRIDVHKAFLEHPELIDAFIAENPFDLDESDLEIAGSWRRFVAGRFYVLGYHKKHAILLSSTDPPVAYGVLALRVPFEVMFGHHLPVLIETRLLPFQGRIVHDGILQAFNISFGGGVRRILDRDYKKAKASRGIVATLPAGPAPSAPVTAKRPGAKSKNKRPIARPKNKRVMAKDEPDVPEPVRPARDRIVALTDEFCREHLDEDFAALCRKLADELARGLPSPLTRGKPESWACGIALAVGFANFMTSDRSQPHYMPTADVSKAFGVSEGTGASKSLEIRNLLGIGRFSPKWTLPSMMDQNPLALLDEFGGLNADVHSLPREVSERLLNLGSPPLDFEDDPSD